MMNTRRKYLLWTTGGLAALVLVCAGVLWKGINGSPFDIDETAYVYVRPGDSAEAVREQFCALGGGSTRLYWRLANCLRPYQVHTGRYAIEPGTSFLRAYLALQRGHQSPVRLTIPSVRTMNRLAGFLSHQLMLDSAETARQLGDSAVAATYGYSTATLPALFIPNTYEVYWTTDAEKLISRLKSEYDSYWNEDRLSYARSQNLSPVEVATLASIVDSETSRDQDKPIIACLYLNRLKKHMRLSSDPTVVFALGDFSLRRVLRRHLEIESPYNTYKHEGLPPGPIRIASVAGIEAVLHPDDNDYLYMCAKEDFSGEHYYTSSETEHMANAKKYADALNKRNIH